MMNDRTNKEDNGSDRPMSETSDDPLDMDGMDELSDESNQSDDRSNITIQSHGRPNIMDMSYRRPNITCHINQYLMHPTDTLTIENTPIDELPEIFASFDRITKLIVVSCRLGSLKNIPPNVRVLVLRDNSLSVVISNDIPNSVEELYLNKNKISLVDLSCSPNIRTLNISHNLLNGYSCFPPNVENLLCTGSQLEQTECFQQLDKLVSLNLNSTNIRSIDRIPDNVRELRCSRTCLKIIVRLPQQLQLFVAHSSEIEEFTFDSFPNSLRELDLYDNALQRVPNFPPSLIRIDLMKNRIRHINLPQTINMINLRDNPIVLTDDNLKIINRLKQPDDEGVYDDPYETRRSLSSSGSSYGFDKKEHTVVEHTVVEHTVVERPAERSERSERRITPKSTDWGVVDAMGAGRTSAGQSYRPAEQSYRPAEQSYRPSGQSYRPAEPRQSFGSIETNASKVRDDWNRQMDRQREMMGRNQRNIPMYHKLRRLTDTYCLNKQRAHKIAHTCIYNL